MNKWLKVCIVGAPLVYAVITYGGWYWATCWQWEDQVGQNGCLSLGYVNPTTIEGTVVSPKTTNSIRTEISSGFPILLLIRRAKFEIPEQGQGGHMSLSLGLNEIVIYPHYDGRKGGPANAAPVRFRRVSTCASQGSQ